MISTRVLLLLVLTSGAYGHTIVREEQEQHDHSVGITGGHTISINQAPFMASIRFLGIAHWCGGSIIHERFILTTAQCVQIDGHFKVSVGSDILEEGGKLYNVVKTILHDQYSRKTGDYDAAVLKLNESMTFGPTVSKVWLKGNGNLVKVNLGTMLNITGWGKKVINYEQANLLQQTTVPVVSNKKCEDFFKYFQVTNRMMCTEATNNDPCMFDAGGPLTYNNVQIGIITTKFGCGQSPSIYTRVKTINHWIKETIRINLEEKEN